MFGFNHINQASDEQLMVLIAKGKQKAFEELYHRYYQKLCRFAYGYLYDTAMAEDIVQDVFIKIIEKTSLFDTNKRFNTWIYTMLANRCKNKQRDLSTRARLEKEQALHIEVVTENRRTDTDKMLLLQTIQTTLKNCSEKEQMIYALRFVEERSIKEIAAIIDIPEGSVKSGIFYLLKKLEQPLKNFRHE